MMKPFNMSTAKSMVVYEKHCKKAHHGRVEVFGVKRLDRGDVVMFQRVDKDIWGKTFHEQRVAFFAEDGQCKWDMIA